MPVVKIGNKFKTIILNVVFPPRCLSCNKFGDWVCKNCWEEIELIKTPICYRCYKLSEGFKLCPVCRKQQALNRVIVCAHWHASLKNIVYGLKYRRVRVITNLLGTLLSQTIKKQWCNGQDAVVVSVPLHRSRYWQRGFNQAESLAKLVAEQNHWPVVTALIRSKPTLPQFGLNKITRKHNLTDAFLLRRGSKQLINGKIVILVDDIVTTGVTLNECAKILRQYGAREVWGLVLARA
ncbi:MAG: ComF family protein [Patescibacteria group bacterium]